MDFDGDGTLDLVSGSYDPGELYLFRGKADGRLAEREVIRDKTGRPILKVPNQLSPIESFGSWMTLVDWDDDGDLDVLVGTFDGLMFVRMNEGSRAEPVYATDNLWVRVGVKRLRVPGGEHANPVVADWDGDGRWDIISGSSDGGVYCYRNVGMRGKPEFSPPATLVPAHAGTGYAEPLRDGQQPRPGIRSQIAVFDYDDDGKLDLLVGDFCTYLQLKHGLTAEQDNEFETILRRNEKVVQHLRGSMDDLRARWNQVMAGVPESEWNTPENSILWQSMLKEMTEAPKYKQWLADRQQLQMEIAQFVDGDPNRPDSPDVPHGFVWLFRRK